MQRHLPPFSAVRAFEAAARHLSFRLAADELHVSHSAVSHQVRHLEDFLGCNVFVRHPAGVTLTEAGEHYLGGLSDVLDALAACTDRARHPGCAGPLRVCTTPAFAARWLAPRAGAFCHLYPGVALQVSTSASVETPDFNATELDFVIGFGGGHACGVRYEPLVTSSRSPVLSPALLREGPELHVPADLCRHRLLKDLVGDQWQEWFVQALGGAPVLPAGPVFEHCELTLRAAEGGQGVALASLFLVSDQLDSGALVRPFTQETAPALVYSMIYPERVSAQPKIRAFREWLIAQVDADRAVTARVAVSAR